MGRKGGKCGNRGRQGPFQQVHAPISGLSPQVSLFPQWEAHEKVERWMVLGQEAGEKEGENGSTDTTLN